MPRLVTALVSVSSMTPFCHMTQVVALSLLGCVCSLPFSQKLVAQLLCTYLRSIDIWFDGFQCLWCLLRIGSSYNQWHTTDTEGGSAVAMVIAYARAA